MSAPLLRLLAVLVVIFGGLAQSARGAEEPPTAPTARVQELLNAAYEARDKGNSAEALRTADAAVGLAEELKDTFGLAVAHSTRAMALLKMGRGAEAEQAFTAGAETFHRGRLWFQELICRSTAAAELPGDAALRNRRFRAVYDLGWSWTDRPAPVVNAFAQIAAEADAQGEAAQARLFWEAWLRMAWQLGVPAPPIFMTLVNLGAVCHLGDDNGSAVRYLTEAMRMMPGLEQPPVAQITAHQNLCVALRGLGLTEEARAHGEAALALASDDPALVLSKASALDNLGQIDLAEGRLPEAARRQRAALALFAEHAAGSRDHAIALANVAMLEGAAGEVKKALALFTQAAEIHRKIGDTRASLDLAGVHLEVGGVLYNQDDLAAAMAAFREALGLAGARLASDPRVAQAIAAKAAESIGDVFATQGDLRRACTNYAQAEGLLTQLDPTSPRLVGVTLRFAGLALAADLLDEATALARKTLARASSGPGGATTRGMAHNILGAVAVRQQRAADAETEFTQALRELTAAGAPHERLVVELNLADITLQRGAAPAAVAQFARIIEQMRGAGEKRSFLAEALQSYGRALLASGQAEPAAVAAREAWELIRAHGQAVAADDARIGFSGETTPFSALVVECELALGRPEAAFLAQEDGRAQALRGLLHEEKLLARAPPSAQERAHRAELYAARLASERAEAAVTVAGTRLADAQRPGAPAAELAAATTARRIAEDDYGKAARAYELLHDRAALDAEERQRAARGAASPIPKEKAAATTLAELARRELPPGAAYLSYVVRADGCRVFLLHRTGAEGRLEVLVEKLPLSAADFAQLCERWRRMLRNPAIRTELTARTGQTIFAAAFPERIARALAGVPRVLISPDGPLWEIPFAALAVEAGESPRYFGAEHALTLTPSLALTTGERPPPAQAETASALVAVILGDPAFPAPAQLGPALAVRGEFSLDALPTDRGVIARLPGSGREAQAVADGYGVAPLLGAAATEQHLRARLGSADVVHLATHGLLSTRDPLASALLLAKPDGAANSGDDDGVLQAWEILDLRLRADLVVLSACDTGRGAIAGGEGIVGLIRALQLAGAASVVASAWPVDDTSTATFMIAFHAGLRAGLDKDAALAAAAAALRQDPATAQPFFWAPFFLVGDPANHRLATRPAAAKP